MNLLLTGATGFVGRNLLLELLQAPEYEEIIVPVRNTEKLRAQFLGDGFEKIPAKVIPISCSAKDWRLHEYKKPIHHAIHCAGLLFAKTYSEFQEVNVEGTLKLLKELRGTQKIVIVSSQAAGGPCGDQVMQKNETDLDTPLTAYGQSKLEMEIKVREVFPQSPVIFVRPPIVLGPRDKATLPLFQLAKSPVRVKPGTQPKYYSFIAVKDLSSALIAALRGPAFDSVRHQSFYVSSEKIITDIDLIETAGRTLKRAGVLVPIPQMVLRGLSKVVGYLPWLEEKVPSLNRDRILEIFPNRWVVTSERFENQFKWKATQNLEATLDETKQWYENSGLL